MTISNFKLVDIAQKHNILLKLIDIIHKDALAGIRPTKLKNLIINFATSDNPGTHFVALLIRNKHAMYFDSFGGYPLKEVVDYCKIHKLKLGYSNYIVQNINSTNCGLYCLGLIDYCGRSGDLYEKSDEYVNLFESQTTLNDEILHRYLKSKGINV